MNRHKEANRAERKKRKGGITRQAKIFFARTREAQSQIRDLHSPAP